MKEIVLDPEEFSKLSEGRVHWAIVKEPIYISKVDGTGRVDSGALSLILSVTAKSKEGNHIIGMRIPCGDISRFSENFQNRLNEIRKAAKEDFPKATEGAFV